MLHGLPAVPTPDQAWALAVEYIGKFALDFAYEDWASEYRGSLHATYLRVIETAIKRDLDTGHFNRGIAIAERALMVEPESDELQASLVRLYRLGGVHAAAAEKYTQYRSTVLDLGVDAPQLDEM